MSENVIDAVSMHPVCRLGGDVRKIFLNLIRGYQLVISPFLPTSCRFTPTCSQYAIEAIERYGVFRGTFLSCRRLLRCHPFNAGGYDPVD